MRAKGKRTHASTAGDGTRGKRAHARPRHMRGHAKNRERAHSASRMARASVKRDTRRVTATLPRACVTVARTRLGACAR
eukprot:2993570-Pleurochrysis_carterae.AAC.1